LEDIIEKSVQFRTNIRDISRRSQSSIDKDNSKKLLFEECDDYRLQMKYLGVEIKVLFIEYCILFLNNKFFSRIDIKVQHGHLKIKNLFFGYTHIIKKKDVKL
jgi:hypothetical protein